LASSTLSSLSYHGASCFCLLARHADAASRIPFYYAFKTLFLLYLVLPQTQGSSFIYLNYIQPFFRIHETDIDAGIASLKSRAYASIQEWARKLWGHALSSVGQQRQADLTAAAALAQGAVLATAAPPTINDPISGPAQLLGNLWNSYGPVMVASGAALLQAGASASAQAAAAPPAPSRLDSSFHNTDATEARRRQLEAELNALNSGRPPAPTPTSPPVMGYDLFGPPQPMPTADASFSRTSSNESDLRARTGGTPGRFEEVEVPSDIEGEQGYVPTAAGLRPIRSSRPGGQQERTASWFGWGGPSAQGYERVRTD
jgi:receptor expression-enhancing protein 1/2/3/4